MKAKRRKGSSQRLQLSGERVVHLALEIASAVSAELEMDALCDLIVRRLHELLRPDTVALLFVQESAGRVTIKRSLGLSAEAERSFSAGLGQGIWASVIARRRALITRGATAEVRQEAGRHVQGGPFGPDPGAVFVAPLIADRRVQGILVLTRSPGTRASFESERTVVDLLCSQIAQAIDNAWLYGQLRQLNAELERKVAARTAELDTKAQALEQTLRDLREMQVHYVQREKMASLGQLTAGVAHEINNPLAYALSNADLARDRVRRTVLALAAEQLRRGGCDLAELERFCACLERLPDFCDDVRALRADLQSGDPAVLGPLFLDYFLSREKKLRHPLEAVESIDRMLELTCEGLARVKQIVLDLRQFSRLDEAEVQLADLDQGVRATLALAEHAARERQVELQFEPGMRGPYACAPSRLNQVVMNLVLNAVHASPLGGTVVVATHDDESGVRIRVLDHGSGIAPEHLPKIFDPFFTTKPPGEGTGLGLSLCYRIVADQGGRIDVVSQLGKGTEFTVMLPPRPRAEGRAEEP